MEKFNLNILTANENICKNIANLQKDNKGFFSQNIIKSLRDLIEAIDQRIYSEKHKIELNKYEDIEKSVAYVASRGDLRFLSTFHYYLQSFSHCMPDEENSIRLMLKYYESLIRIRTYVKRAFNLAILQNLEDYPLEQDDSLKEYYEKISKKLDTVDYYGSKPNYRFYVQKTKPFFVHNTIYYEVTVVPADDFSSKFNRFTVFSKKEIPTYYAIKLDFIDTYIEILNRKMPIKIINNFKVAIRPIEFEDFATIIGEPKVNTGTKEYYVSMDFLTETGMSFVEIIDMEDSYYYEIRETINDLCESHNLFNILDKCRLFSKKGYPGRNILRYLLLKMRHSIMKEQIGQEEKDWCSGLKLDNACYPFEDMPFDASLHKHNPALFDIFSSISLNGREEELLSRRIRKNTEQNVQLFTPLKDVENIGDIRKLSEKFNLRLAPQHITSRSLIVENEMVHISGYVNDSLDIINDLRNRIGTGLSGYKNSVTYWLDNSAKLDSKEKYNIIQTMFVDSNIALIYGAAGTGKTTLIKHIAEYFANQKKLFLANTNPAKENLRRKIMTVNSQFTTIASSYGLIERNHYDIVVIDECSTVDNFAMKKLLSRLTCSILVLVGDIYQIQSIKFGNWFSLAKNFMPKNLIYTLNTPFRTKNPELIELWNRVRILDNRIPEQIARNQYAEPFGENIFKKENDDEVILCLNYDGLYGINNINRFLQYDNPSKPIYWDTWIYKINDPVIFNENNRFYPTLYNNLKGWIRNIQKNDKSITFEIEVDMPLDGFDAQNAGFELLDCAVVGHSLIRFSVDHFVDDDKSEKGKKQVIPFQVAYAISIHKAQGLEYDSVKIIVTNEIEELITHNIFYTAITRARNKLKIFWSPETQQKVLSQLEILTNDRDANIISNKYHLKRYS